MRKILLALFILACLSRPAYADRLLDDALFYAASQGDLAKTQKLLAQGANPSVHNQASGFSALMAACLFTDDSLARLLVKSGADINQRTAQGESALYYAVARNNTKLGLMLIANGADAQIVTTNGTTPYQVARRNGNEALMSALAFAEKRMSFDRYPAVTTESGLQLLDESSPGQAKNEAELNRADEAARKLTFYYPLGFNYIQNLLEETLLNKSPAPRALLITPYSLLRHQYAQAPDGEVPDGVLDEIYAHKNIAWLFVAPGHQRPFIDKVLLKAGGKEYPPLSRTLYTPPLLRNMLGGADNLWIFPLNLFSAKPPVLDIVIRYPDGQRQVIKINAEQYIKTPLK